MDLETVRRISLARHLFELARSSLRSSNDLHLFASANLMQDAVEAFLIAVGDKTGAQIDQTTKFDKYFVLINERIAPKELPFKTKLLRLNRIRIDSKHYGIQPARDECVRMETTVSEFFEETSTSVLDVNFWTLSTIDLLNDGEVKDLLFEAKAQREAGELVECMTTCRKAIFLSVEFPYSIHQYLEADSNPFFFDFSHAPSYARNKSYIDKNVGNPTDYIVRDHDRIDQELLTLGVDTTAFWNIWRLTPEVYRKADKEWAIKHDFSKLADDVVKNKVDYVFSTTVDIVLAIHTSRSAIKLNDHARFYAELKRDNVNVYDKADTGSKIVGSIASGTTRIDTDYKVEGLKGDGPYWHIQHKEGGVWLVGYIHEDDIV